MLFLSEMGAKKVKSSYPDGIDSERIRHTEE